MADLRLVTIRRGGALSDEDHHLLALWAAACAEHVLPLFEAERPDDPRPREAIEAIRSWTRGQVRMWGSRSAGGHAMAAARDLAGAARRAAYAAGQAGVVAHVAAHELGCACYALRAVLLTTGGPAAAERERRWQVEHLPQDVPDLGLDDTCCRAQKLDGAFDR